MRRERLYNILQGAHISEKANMIADKKNCFTYTKVFAALI